ncbi:MULTISPECIES: alpha/beta hydrolase [unclassified Anabaena]|uniref:alpha/beta hydrolase n=1 Tax=unclassified Anabaena TaxID=2619674 RepID=UPI002B1FE006|nr:alpha/beta hydrolase [Anabaena sp. UHCC 0399]MEA5564994.1 alpha/beta hydrolase [Anabaena sp. UHCC 0399]
MQYITVPPANSQTPAGLVVTLHGWGANAEDVSSLVPHINLPQYQFVLPNAPFPFPHSPLGRAWYDLSVENMYQGLVESRQILTDFLLSLEASTGVPLSRTVLSGFSQGGAMTLDVGSKLPLAGLVVMSGYLHPDAIATNHNLPPILIMHGRRDEVVPLQAAVKARETVASLGVVAEYHEFDTGHEINLQMLDVARNFMIKTIV